MAGKCLLQEYAVSCMSQATVWFPSQVYSTKASRNKMQRQCFWLTVLSTNKVILQTSESLHKQSTTVLHCYKLSYCTAYQNGSMPLTDLCMLLCNNRSEINAATTVTIQQATVQPGGLNNLQAGLQLQNFVQFLQHLDLLIFVIYIALHGGQFQGNPIHGVHGRLDKLQCAHRAPIICTCTRPLSADQLLHQQ